MVLPGDGDHVKTCTRLVACIARLYVNIRLISESGQEVRRWPLLTNNKLELNDNRTFVMRDASYLHNMNDRDYQSIQRITSYNDIDNYRLI